MPIFDYKCRDCGEIFEKIVRSRDEQISCGNCQSKNVERLLSGFAVGRTGCGQEGDCGHHCNGRCCHDNH